MVCNRVVILVSDKFEMLRKILQEKKGNKETKENVAIKINLATEWECWKEASQVKEVFAPFSTCPRIEKNREDREFYRISS